MKLTQKQYNLMQEVTKDAGEQKTEHYKGTSFTFVSTYVFTEDDAAEIEAPIAGCRMVVEGRGEYDWGRTTDKVTLEERIVVNHEPFIWRKLDDVHWEPEELERLESLIPRTLPKYRPINVEIL